MIRPTTSSAIAVATILAITLGLSAGCGTGAAVAEADKSTEAQGLRNLGAMYRVASESLSRPPKTIAELRKAEAQVPGGFSDIGETNVAIYLGVPLPPASGGPTDGASETVLAYDRMAPHQGGYVLRLDGSVKKLTAAEFKAARKAGSKPWMSAPGS
jgi:hypothetical protein